MRFWAETVNTAAHVLNCTGTSSVKGSTPYKLWYGKESDIRHLRIFGEEVYSHIPKIKRQKWDPKGQRGILIGYEENVKGYRIWYPEENIIKTVRDVIFTGNTSPMNSSKRNDGDDLWISTQQNPNEETINDEEDEPEAREKL